MVANASNISLLNNLKCKVDQQYANDDHGDGHQSDRAADGPCDELDHGLLRCSSSCARKAIIPRSMDDPEGDLIAEFELLHCRFLIEHVFDSEHTLFSAWLEASQG